MIHKKSVEAEIFCFDAFFCVILGRLDYPNTFSILGNAAIFPALVPAFFKVFFKSSEVLAFESAL